MLVRRGRVTRQQLGLALGDARLTGKPLDEILVSRGYATRQAVASTVLAVQLGFEGQGTPESGRVPGSASSPERRFGLRALTLDLALLILAVAGAVVGHRGSSMRLPSPGLLVLFVLLTLFVYWSWRLFAFRVKLRPLADAVLFAAAASVAAMLVLSVQSVTGQAGLGDQLLPLWAVVAAYGVVGRLAFSLAGGARGKRQAAPAASPAAP